MVFYVVIQDNNFQFFFRKFSITESFNDFNI